MNTHPLWVNALLFALAAGAIWWAGTRLERYADTISERTGLGHAFTGGTGQYSENRGEIRGVRSRVPQ
jgi:hypothetical protein